MTDKKIRKLRRNQLDRLLSHPLDLRKIQPPPDGWIKEVREILGMSAVALAKRLRVAPQRISVLEQAELDETVSLQKLREAAEALGCNLTYIFVPKTSFEGFLQQQAKWAARAELAATHATMALEDQALDAKAREYAVKELAEEMIQNLDRRIWNDK